VSGARCKSPLSLGLLSDYGLGEPAGGDEAPTGAGSGNRPAIEPTIDIEEHLLACGECSRRLAWVVELAGATRVLARRGLLRVVVGDGHLRRLANEGLHIREYKVAAGGSVACTIAPEDDLVVARLAAPFPAREQVDLVFCDATGQEQARLPDVALDLSRGEVVFTEPVDGLRRLGKATVRVKLVAVEARVDHVLGEYTFNHTPPPGP
jgi:hypothetical protein